MSRALFTVTVSIELQNGQSGNASCRADTLTTLREVRAVLDRAYAMAEQLAREPAVEGARPAFGVVGGGRSA
jgi:hypothetical protein